MRLAAASSADTPLAVRIGKGQGPSTRLVYARAMNAMKGLHRGVHCTYTRGGVYGETLVVRG